MYGSAFGMVKVLSREQLEPPPAAAAKSQQLLSEAQETTRRWFTVQYWLTVRDRGG